MKKEKIINFYNENKNIIGIIIESVIIIGFFLYIDKDKKLFDIFFYSLLIIILLYNFIFNIDGFEKFIVKNFTRIIIIGILLIISLQSKLGIDNTNIFLMIGGIIAFWYGFKKYERDKELEFLQNYKIDENQTLDDIFSKWLIVHHLNNKGYISNDTWEKINNINKTLFETYLEKLSDSKVRLELINKITFPAYISNDFFILIFNIIKDFLKKQERVIKNMIYLYGDDYTEKDKKCNELIVANLKILINNLENTIQKDKNIS